jgi:hypothetical protein
MKQQLHNRWSDSDRALAAAMLQRLQRGGDLRTSKVARLRGAIAAGGYENALKLDVAMERLMESQESPLR